jgi:hypothetical protein
MTTTTTTSASSSASTSASTSVSTSVSTTTSQPHYPSELGVEFIGIALSLEEP